MLTKMAAEITSDGNVMSTNMAHDLISADIMAPNLSLASSPVRKSVACECGVSRSAEKWLCQFPRNDVVVLLDIALHLLYQEKMNK